MRWFLESFCPFRTSEVCRKLETGVIRFVHFSSKSIEFESIDAARKFYESEKYQAAKAVRELAAKAHLVLVEGN